MFLFDALYNLGIFAIIIFVSVLLGFYFFQNNLLYMPGNSKIAKKQKINPYRLVIMGSGIQKSSSGNPNGYKNPGERLL